MSDEMKDLKNALAQAQQGLQQDNDLQQELETLRREKTERDELQAVQGLVGDIVQGVKSSQVEENERLSKLVSAELTKQLGGDAAQSLVANAVARASALRLGRKFQPDTTGDVGVGSKGGGTYIPSHKLGEKANFTNFLCAIGRKDISTIRDMQRASGMEAGYGGRALVSGTGALDTVAGPSGGYLVPPEFSTQLIDALYARVALRRGGATVQQMSSPTFIQPRLTGQASAAYIGETAAIAASQETFDQVRLVAKKLAGMCAVSAELVATSDPAVSDIVIRDLSRVIGLAEDYAFLLGAGSSTVPQGILTAAGVTTINPTDGTNGDAPSYNDIVDMETELMAANVPMVNTIWLCHPRMLGALRKIKDDDLRPIFSDMVNPQVSTLAGATPVLMGKPVICSTQLPIDTISGKKTTNLALVEASQVLIGQLAELEIQSSNEASYVDGSSNTLSAWQNDLVIFRGILRSDVAVLQPKAIVYRKGLLYT